MRSFPTGNEALPSNRNNRTQTPPTTLETRGTRRYKNRFKTVLKNQPQLTRTIAYLHSPPPSSSLIRMSNLAAQIASAAAKNSRQNKTAPAAPKAPLPRRQNPYPQRPQTLTERLTTNQKSLEERIWTAPFVSVPSSSNNVPLLPTVPTIPTISTTPEEPEREECEVQHCTKDSVTKKYPLAYWTVTEVDEYADYDDDSDDEDGYEVPTRQFYACNRCVRIYRNKKRTATKTILNVEPYTPK